MSMSMTWTFRPWLVALVTALVLAATPAKAALSTADQADVARANEYLNTIVTLKARFLQDAPNGDEAQGTVYLWRPGRLRLDYDPPSPVQVYADGSSLIYYDKKLKQVTYLDLDSSPAGVLTRSEVNLNASDLEVTKVSHGADVLNITVVRRADRSQGSLTLVFSDHPFALRQWRVVDPQGQVTTVALFAPQPGIPLDKDLFQFVDPKFASPLNGVIPGR
jgi:outer membrane lipoprotein-sorting protein